MFHIQKLGGKERNRHTKDGTKCAALHGQWVPRQRPEPAGSPGRAGLVPAAGARGSACAAAWCWATPGPGVLFCRLEFVHYHKQNLEN